MTFILSLFIRPPFIPLFPGTVSLRKNIRGILHGYIPIAAVCAPDLG